MKQTIVLPLTYSNLVCTKLFQKNFFFRWGMKIVIPSTLGRNIGSLKKLILYLILMKGTCPDWPKIQFTKSSFS